MSTRESSSSTVPWSNIAAHYLGADPLLDRITVRDVLRHSSGLPNWADGPLTTIAAPGAAYTYSGEGFVWLQLIVEKMTGEGAGAAVERMLLQPAGMTRSTMGWDERVARDAAYGHEEPTSAPSRYRNNRPAY